MQSLFWIIFYNVAHSTFVLLGITLTVYVGFNLFDYFGHEKTKIRELKRKLWREFRLTYYELLPELGKQEMKEMVHVFENTFKNSLTCSKPKVGDHVALDLSPKKSKSSMRRVFFDLPMQSN